MTLRGPDTEAFWEGAEAAWGMARRNPSPPAPRAGLAPEEAPIPPGPVTFMFTRNSPFETLSPTSAPASLKHG
jgi:hypothetical protein